MDIRIIIESTASFEVPWTSHWTPNLAGKVDLFIVRYSTKGHDGSPASHQLWHSLLVLKYMLHLVILLLWKLTLPIPMYIELANAFTTAAVFHVKCFPLYGVVIELADLGVLRLVP